MTPPLAPRTPPPLPVWKSGAARGLLALESLVRAFWRAGVWVMGGAGLILSDLPSFFGPWGPAAAGAVFYIGFLGLAVAGARAFRWPSSHDALRRIERAGPLAHRPLTSAADRPAGPFSHACDSLWALSRERARQEARNARLFAPEPVVTRRDPFALAQGAGLVLAAGLIVAGAQAPARLAQALWPFGEDAGLKGADDDILSLRVTPPAYTGLGAFTVTGGRLPEGTPPLRIPQGAQIKLRVPGGWGGTFLPAPVFSMGGQDHPLTPLDPRAYGGAFPAAPPAPGAPARLEVRRLGLTRARFDYDYIADTPPGAREKAPADVVPQGQIRFSFLVKDDYGVRDLTATVEPDPSKGGMPLGEPVRATRPVLSAPGVETELRPVYDLSAHPWAGLPVLMRFTFTDAIGQSAEIGPVPVVLPERAFRHPVSRRLVALRKALGRAPLSTRLQTSRDVEEILARPGLYAGDPIVFLALRSAASRLYYNTDTRSVREVMDLLWDTALRIEDGNLSLAARDLRSARDALEKALRDPATTDEALAELNDRLREALASYFLELGREIQKRMAQGESVPTLPPDMMAQALDGDALARFLDRLNAESLSGNREKAMDMLSRLQKLTDSLGSATTAPMPEDLKAMAQGISDLQELVQRQEALRDQTQNQARGTARDQDFSWPDLLPPKTTEEGAPHMGPMPPAPNADPNARPLSLSGNARSSRVEQEALRRVLGEIMKEVGAAAGDVPENLGKAELNMRDAAQALGDNDPGGALPHQDAALQNLRQGAQSMAQSLSHRLEQMTGLSFGAQGGLDPLGRPRRDRERASGLLDDEEVKIPTEAERRRVDDILKTLRDRAADPSRPEVELDYLRRLLKQF